MLLPVLPQARELLGDRGYDSAGFRADLLARGIQPCIPSTRKRKIAIPHDSTLYRQRHRIENAFVRLKDWRASPRATTDAPTRSSPPSASPQPLSSGCRNES
jgi:transposase